VTLVAEDGIGDLVEDTDLDEPAACCARRSHD
jgi:hypothetical protein